MGALTRRSCRRLPGAGRPCRDVASALAADELLGSVGIEEGRLLDTLARGRVDVVAEGVGGCELSWLPPLWFRFAKLSAGGVPGVVCEVLLPPLLLTLPATLMLPLARMLSVPLTDWLLGSEYGARPPVIIVRGSGATHYRKQIS
jgi:hypothetical protein